jgi:hypothetical protein
MNITVPAAALAILLTPWLPPAVGSQESSSGTLLVDVKPYESDVDMNKNVRKQLEHAGLEWGVVDHTIVFTLVDKRFVNAELPHMTRYGESKALELKSGDYTITCIGFVLASTSSDVEKSLSSSAFVNENVMTFTISHDRITTVKVLPIFQKQAKRGFRRSISVLVPDLAVSVLGDEAPKAAITINKRTPSSIAWDIYSGPLKFTAGSAGRKDLR